jgi:hypothetical protein
MSVTYSDGEDDFEDYEEDDFEAASLGASSSSLPKTLEQASISSNGSVRKINKQPTPLNSFGTLDESKSDGTSKHKRKGNNSHQSQQPATSPIHKSSSQTATIEKLRLSNNALRSQLKEFARALDASLKNNKKASERALEPSSKSMKIKAQVVKNMKQKIEIYKRANNELKRQLKETRDNDKVIELENLVNLKEREIHKLVKDNKSLLAIQRNQAKQISAKENLKHEWPQRITSLENDVKVYREKLRKVRARDIKFADERRSQKVQLGEARNKNRRLKAQLEDMRSVLIESGENVRKKKGVKTVEEAVKSATAQLEQRIKKLSLQVTLLEKTKSQEAMRHKRLIRKKELELKAAMETNEKLHKQLAKKEKQVRMQVLQVKKVKKQLHEIVMKEEPINLPRRVPSFVPAAPPTENRIPSRVNPSPLVTSRSNVAPVEKTAAVPQPGVLSEDIENVVNIPAVKKEERIVSNSSNEEAEKKTSEPIMGEDEKNAAVKLQAGYRGFSDRRRVSEIKQENKAATQLQSQYRGYQSRKKSASIKERRDRDEAFDEQQRYEQERKKLMKENDGRNPTESSSKSTEKRGAVLTEDGVGAATTESKPMQHEEKSSEAVDEPKKGAFTKPGARRKKKEKRKYY